MQEDNSENYLKLFWLDTSVLAKIFFNEKGSKEIKKIFNGNPDCQFYTSDYCRCEFINVLKRKLTDIINPITTEDYFKHIRVLSNYVRIKKLNIDDTDLDSGANYRQIVQLAKKYNLDFTDAIQFISLQNGSLNIFRGGESEPILVTSDTGMIKAAKGENMQFWNPEKGFFMG